MQLKMELNETEIEDAIKMYLESKGYRTKEIFLSYDKPDSFHPTDTGRGHYVVAWVEKAS